MLSKEISVALGFDKVGENLSHYFLAEDSTQQFLQKRPCMDIAELELIQEQVSLFQDCSRLHAFSADRVLPSLAPLFLHASKRDLHLEEIVLLRKSLQTLHYYVQWIRESDFTYMDTRRFSIHLYESLSFYFDEKGEIRTHKIPELKRLHRTRKEIQQQRSRIADEFIRNNDSLCQGEQPTIRDEKILVPIRSSFRSRVDGSIYASSASKETVYMELNSMRAQNNKMRDLLYEEQKILYDICRNLSLVFQKEQSGFKRFYQDFLCFDLIQAQHRYGAELNAQVPLSYVLSASGKSGKSDQSDQSDRENLLLLKDARHPLVADANPITIRIPRGSKQLVLTGPNGGGKTFALKTLGLLVLMHQSGIPIPVSEGSQLPIFSDLAVVIGDQQNLQQGLSTFSAHLHALQKGIKNLNTGDKETLRLFLIDEICSDTDDREGAALAWAILELLATDAIVVGLSTHLALLKQYAISSPTAEIACIDPEGLGNKHSIVYGLAGLSEVERCARQVGLASSLIDRHLALLEEHGKEHHDYLKKLNSLIHDWKERQSELMQKEDAIEEKEAMLQRAKKKLKEDEILLKEAGVHELQGLRARMRKALEKNQEIHSQLLQQEENAANSELVDLRNEAKALSKDVQAFEKDFEEQRNSWEEEVFFYKGDEVFLKKSRHRGIVQKELSGNYYTVLVGIVNLKAHVSELTALEDMGDNTSNASNRNNTSDTSNRSNASNASSTSPASHYSSRKRAGYVLEKVESKFSYSLDLRGCRVDEALDLLEKNIDSAIIHGVSVFSVIHGKGYGILRRAIQEHLAAHTEVKEYHFTNQGEGGFGNTKVILAL